MRKFRFTESQIAAILKEGSAGFGVVYQKFLRDGDYVAEQVGRSCTSCAAGCRLETRSSRDRRTSILRCCPDSTVCSFENSNGFERPSRSSSGMSCVRAWSFSTAITTYRAAIFILECLPRLWRSRFYSIFPGSVPVGLPCGHGLLATGAIPNARSFAGYPLGKSVLLEAVVPGALVAAAVAVGGTTVDETIQLSVFITARTRAAIVTVGREDLRLCRTPQRHERKRGQGEGTKNPEIGFH